MPCGRPASGSFNWQQLTHLWLNHNPDLGLHHRDLSIFEGLQLLNIEGCALEAALESAKGAPLSRLTSEAVQTARITVEFMQKTLTAVACATVAKTERGYVHGWVCDGCQAQHGCFSPITMYHGEDLDLCADCAADPPAAEAQHKQREQELDELEERREQQRRRKQLRQNRHKMSRFGSENSGSSGSASCARMLFPHSGRDGFAPLRPDPAVPTPPKAQLLAMLAREKALRYGMPTQRKLDQILLRNLVPGPMADDDDTDEEGKHPRTDRVDPVVVLPPLLPDAHAMIQQLVAELATQTAGGPEEAAAAATTDSGFVQKEEAGMERALVPAGETTSGIADLKSSELKAALAALGQDAKGSRATLRAKLSAYATESDGQSKAVQAVVAEQLLPGGEDREGTVRLDDEDDDDAAVFAAIKLQVIREFGLSDDAVDLLYSAAARFPGDADIVEAAPYLKYNRSHCGKIDVGAELPVDTLQLADMSTGQLQPLRSHLQAPGSATRTLIAAGSIT
jgi:hypothetical protein